MKNLQVINIQILLENDWDEQMVKEKFKQAEDTIDQKFQGDFISWKGIMLISNIWMTI